LLLEAAAGVVLLLVVIPRWGIVGAAWVSASLMIFNRGLVAAWLISRTVGISAGQYLKSVYARPAVAALPVVALCYSMRATILAGGNWIQILALALIGGASYYGLAFFVALERGHRSLLMDWIASWRNQAALARVAHG
jgi:uncharacterized metal-binding protein